MIVAAGNAEGLFCEAYCQWLPRVCTCKDIRPVSMPFRMACQGIVGTIISMHSSLRSSPYAVWTLSHEMLAWASTLAIPLLL